MKKYIVILFCILQFACGINNRKDLTEISAESFFTINYEQALENKKELRLSEIASDVEYVRLETNDSCLLRPVVNYFFTDSLIFVQNFDHILKFSRNGKFIQKIGKPGRGPGEIDLIRIMSLLPEKKLIVIQLNYQRKLYYMSYEGKILNIVDFEKPISYVKVCPDGKYILHERGAEGYEKYSFCLTSEKWDTLSRVKNYMNWENKSGMVISIGYPSFQSFYLSGDRMYMKDMYNDTVYSTDADRICPAYYIDLGKYRLPGDLRPEKLGVNGISQFNENGSKYYFATAHESAGRIFLATHSYRGAPSRYVLYDKSSGNATFLADGNDPAKGFLNDWDGIIDFWPIGSINEKQVFMPVNVMDLQKLLSENTLKTAFYPEKQSQLKQMISQMDPGDNPVLMIVSLKK
ncbi:MAG TPA: 6-bladed beta-propeller [Bacteroidales bacterium]|nr:6-bladed beta-propeller [Bacteroidales bacterium]